MLTHQVTSEPLASQVAATVFKQASQLPESALMYAPGRLDVNILVLSSDRKQ